MPSILQGTPQALQTVARLKALGFEEYELNSGNTQDTALRAAFNIANDQANFEISPGTNNIFALVEGLVWRIKIQTSAPADIAGTSVLIWGKAKTVRPYIPQVIFAYHTYSPYVGLSMVQQASTEFNTGLYFSFLDEFKVVNAKLNPEFPDVVTIAPGEKGYCFIITPDTISVSGTNTQFIIPCLRKSIVG